MDLRAEFPELPASLLWKTELLFRGIRFSDALAAAAAEGAAPNFWPYRRRDAYGGTEAVPVPYLFHLDGGGVARVRVDDASPYRVGRAHPGAPFALYSDDRDDDGGDGALCEVAFVPRHGWQDARTRDGLTPLEAGVEQLGDMVVVNVAPGCEYFRATADGKSLRCTYCGYGRFDHRARALGQHPGQVDLDPAALARLDEVLRLVVGHAEVHHVYITGGSVLDPADETRRFLPVVEAVRRAVGDRLRVTIGCGAVDAPDSARLRDAGADSACYNLEVWDAATFRAACPGKHAHVGRDRWLAALHGAVDVFGRGNVASAMVAGLELRPPAPGMSAEAMLASIVEGATHLLDHGIVPVYSPLWPVPGTHYQPADGISPAQYLALEHAVYRLREARDFPIPAWLLCPGCSYMLLEVDFDRAFGLGAAPAGAGA
ncbi:MAG: hypothetical protein H6709_03580 [Kofleriaceae bacterium]|nr:hypothetical protein [Kofleriaceae bacterium]MCB9571150.1 hypothetical protein [Kofleriaceae bacterium]